MPTDLARARALPTGRPIALALHKIFQRQQIEALAQIRAGRHFTTKLRDWTRSEIIDVFVPLVTPFYQRGGRDASRRIVREARRRGIATLSTQRAFGRTGAFVLLHKDFVALQKDTAVGFDVFNPRVTEFIRQQIFHFIDSANKTSEDMLRTAMTQALQAGESPIQITRRLQAIFSDPKRSQMIAATEASRAVHAGQTIAAKDSGVVVGLQWLASADACDVCLELAGKEIELGGSFAVEPNGGPYAVISHPPRHPRCMCSMTEVIGRP